MRRKQNFRHSTTPPEEYLFDIFGVADFGFSFRKLSSNYNGSCLKVKRRSDSATLDIGFVNGYVDTSTLISFIGSSYGELVRFYNQNGSGNDLIVTSSTQYALIVENGTLIAENGFVCVKFINGISSTINVLDTARQSRYIVQKFTTVQNGISRIIGVFGNGNQFYVSNGGTKYAFYNGSGAYIASTVNINTNINLVGYVINGNASKMYRNNNIIASGNIGAPASVTTGITGIAIPTLFSEIISYNSEKSTDNADINTNINTFYNIY